MSIPLWSVTARWITSHSNSRAGKISARKMTVLVISINLLPNAVDEFPTRKGAVIVKLGQNNPRFPVAVERFSVFLCLSF